MNLSLDMGAGLYGRPESAYETIHFPCKPCWSQNRHKELQEERWRQTTQRSKWVASICLFNDMSTLMGN